MKLYKQLVVAFSIILVTASVWYITIKFYHKSIELHGNKANTETIAIKNDIKTGDIIFQTSRSAQSEAIQAATNSVYSHCGIIVKKNDLLYVYEAVQPVKITPLRQWVARGQGSHFVIKRLKNAKEILTPVVMANMQKTGATFMGKNYDPWFEWSDERIYCSELVWKIYNRTTGLSVGQLQQLKDFNLSLPAVKRKLKERYGNNIPLHETVISPSSIFNSDLLATVVSR